MSRRISFWVLRKALLFYKRASSGVLNGLRFVNPAVTEPHGTLQNQLNDN